jgi:hypothetical protein
LSDIAGPHVQRAGMAEHATDGGEVAGMLIERLM